MNEADKKKLETYLKDRAPKELWDSLTAVAKYIKLTNAKGR